MRITYRTLAALINKMSEIQKDTDVTVEIETENECYAAELRICDDEHDSLDENHPVIFVPNSFIDTPRSDDVEALWVEINGIHISDT